MPTNYNHEDCRLLYKDKSQYIYTTRIITKLAVRMFLVHSSVRNVIYHKQAKKKLEQRLIMEEASDTEVDEHQGYESDGEQGPEEEQNADTHVGDITKFLALFILKTKEENQLSQQSIDSILANTEDVVETSLQYLKDKISNCLADSNIQIEDVNGLADVFREPCVFSRE